MAFSWLQGKDPNQKNPYTSGTNVFDPFSAKHNEEVFRDKNPVNDLTQSNTAGRTGLTNQLGGGTNIYGSNLDKVGSFDKSNISPMNIGSMTSTRIV